MACWNTKARSNSPNFTRKSKTTSITLCLKKVIAKRNGILISRGKVWRYNQWQYSVGTPITRESTLRHHFQMISLAITSTVTNLSLLKKAQLLGRDGALTSVVPWIPLLEKEINYNFTLFPKWKPKCRSKRSNLGFHSATSSQLTRPKPTWDSQEIVKNL